MASAIAAPPNVVWRLEPASGAPLVAQQPATFFVRSDSVAASVQNFKLQSTDAAATFNTTTVAVAAFKDTSAPFTFTPGSLGTRCLVAQYLNDSIGASYCAHVAAGSPHAAYTATGISAGNPVSVSFSVRDSNSVPIASADELFFVSVYPDTPYAVSPSLGATVRTYEIPVWLRLKELRINANTPTYQFTFPSPGRYELRFYSALTTNAPYLVAAFTFDVLTAAAGSVPPVFLASDVSLPINYAAAIRCPASGTQCLYAGVTVWNTTTLAAPPGTFSAVFTTTTDTPSVISFIQPPSQYSAGIMTIPLIVGTNGVVGSTYGVTVRIC